MERIPTRSYNGSLYEIEYYAGEDYTKTQKGVIVAPNFIEATKMALDIVHGIELNIATIREISTNVLLARDIRT